MRPDRVVVFPPLLDHDLRLLQAIEDLAVKQFCTASAPMRQKSPHSTVSAEKTVRDIRRKTRRKHSTEEKIRIVLEGLRGTRVLAASPHFTPQSLRN